MNLSRVSFMWAVGFAAVFAGCAVGNEYDLHKTMPMLNAKGSGRIAVGTHDQRTEVVSGDDDPDVIGVQRGGFGNAFDVTTASDKPLASDITMVVVRALQQQGFTVEAVDLPHTVQNAVAMDTMRQRNTDRAVVITIRQFRTDTYTNVGFDYALHVAVISRDGSTVAEASLTEGRNLKGSFLNPPAHAKQAVPRAFREAIEKLFNKPEISAAIAGQPVVSVLMPRVPARPRDF